MRMAVGIFTETIDYDTELTPKSPFPEWIETDRLRFERLTPESVSPKLLYESFNNNEGTDRYFTTDEPLGTTWSDVYDQYEEADQLWEKGTFAFYALFTRDKHDFIGFGTIEDIDLSKHRAEIGIWLHQRAWGNGYSQERAEALLEILFNHLYFELVEMTVVTENENSINSVNKYISKFGGSFDGKLRHATYTPTGDIHDVYKWSISRSEFNDPDAEYSKEVCFEP